MKTKNLLPSLVITGAALGTAWAVRGQFGHEHGAAWAGAIGCLTVLLLANRKDWWPHALTATVAGGLGWGIGGIMSYGRVVGYGRSIDFGNVYYGLLSLFVIGALYGCIGGGLFGIALSEFKKKSVPWHRLILEMLGGGFLAYFFMIRQFEWFMTPPREELWAACAGAAIAMIAFMRRHSLNGALKVALFSAFGAGFGFAFGNFLQVLGNVLEIRFNLWNVMEYSLGFFGGVGMAYGVFTTDWKEKAVPQNRYSWVLPLCILSVVIPVVMWQQNIESKTLAERFEAILSPVIIERIAFIKWLPYVVFVGLTAYWYKRFNRSNSVWDRPDMVSYHSVLFGLYILLSILITGALFSTYRIEQYLYVINFAAVLFFLPRVQPDFAPEEINWKQFGLNVVWLALFVALLAVIASQSHPSDLNGAHRRF